MKIEKIYRERILPHIKWVSIGILVIGIILDIIVKTMGTGVIVDNNFIYYTYAAIATIGAFSGTLISILVSSFSDEHYGYTVKEISNFRYSNLRISYLMPIAFLLILLSSLFLSIELINTIVSLLVVLLLMIVSYSYHVWRIVTSKEYCKDLVKNEIKNNVSSDDESIMIETIQSISRDYAAKVKINTKDALDSLTLIEELFLKLNEIENTDKSYVKDLNALIENLYLVTFDNQGIKFAVDWILKLCNEIKTLSALDREEYIIKPVTKLAYIDDKKYYEEEQVTGFYFIIESDVLSDREKIIILYQYFRNLNLNSSLSKDLKNKLQNEFIGKTSDFRYEGVEKYSSLRTKITMYLFRDFVLLNENEQERKALYYEIIKSVHGDGYSDGKFYSITIALILESLYYYTFFEKETLKEKYRYGLKGLVSYIGDNKHAKDISISRIYQEKRKEILRGLFNSSIDVFGTYSFLDYFPDNFGAKSAIWSDSQSITFAFQNYMLYGFLSMKKPFEYIDNWDEIMPEKKIKYLYRMIESFEGETRLLKSHFIEGINQISTWINARAGITDDFQKKVFDWLSEEVKKTNKEIVEKIELKIPELEEINRELNKQLKYNRQNFGFDEDFNVGAETYEKELTYVEEILYIGSVKHIASRVYWSLERELNNIINDKFEPFSLSFDVDGVEAMINLIKENGFDSTNFQYVDDWGFNKEIRDMDKFKTLTKLYEGITINNIRPYQRSVIFNNDALKFNIEVVNYNKPRDLNEMELDQLLHRFKINDGVYVIKNAWYNKSTAIEAIKGMYKVEHIEFRIMSNTKKGDGVIFDFTY